MRETVDSIVRLTGLRYEGLDPLSFEPRFLSAGGRQLEFDALPTRTRHLVAYVAITIKTRGAYPADPRRGRGRGMIDDADLHQDAHVLRKPSARCAPRCSGCSGSTARRARSRSGARAGAGARRLTEDCMRLFVDERADALS
jgi:hypothetical protein